MKKIFCFGAIALSASLFIYSCKKEKVESNNFKEYQEEVFSAKNKPEKTPDKQIERGIDIRRKYNWKITNSTGNCETGKGLCISAGGRPDPGELIFSGGNNGNGSNADPFGDHKGSIIRDLDSKNHIVLRFSNNFVQIEDELIVEDKFLIDVDVNMDKKMSKSIGFESQKTIKKGEYDLRRDNKGIYHIIVEVY